MLDSFYPTVDISFIEEKIIKSGHTIPNSKQKIGQTTMFVMTGEQAISKRLILIREIDEAQVSYEQSTGIAIKLGFLSEVMEWLKVKRQWVEGAYTLANQSN